MRSLLRAGGVMPLVAVAMALAACGADGSPPGTPSGTASGASSPSSSGTPVSGACAVVPADPAARPPSDVPTPPDATFYRKVTSGATTLYFAYAGGADVRARRDAIVALLKDASYQITGEDAEANEEAEAEFAGKGHGDSSVQVKHREGCETQLRIRYRLES